MRKFKVSIYMDSGAVIPMDCDDFTIKQNSEGSFVSMKWVNNSSALFSIDLTHVIAVTGIENKE
jgi:hypothetical protein